MKRTLILAKLAVIGLLSTTIGCNNFGLSSVDENTLDSEAELARAAAVEAEMASIGGRVDLEGKDAVFALGWKEFYNRTDETIQTHFEAFALAPDAEAANRGRGRGGIDMGAVALNYDDASQELSKIEQRNGGVFYSLGKKVRGGRNGGMEEETPVVEVPFLPGGTYTFSASGSDVFDAVSVAVTAPANPLAITSPENGVLPEDGELTVTWEGGVSDQPIAISIRPIFDRSAFQMGEQSGERGGGKGGKGKGGRGGKGRGDGGRGDHEHGERPGRYLLETNDGSFAIPAEDLAKLFEIENLLGASIHVTQMLTFESEQDERSFAVQLRVGDLVQLGTASSE